METTPRVAHARLPYANAGSQASGRVQSELPTWKVTTFCSPLKRILCIYIYVGFYGNYIGVNMEWKRKWKLVFRV